jgi:nitrite reductase/ring-hydroxylating ferredoxin subunit
METTTMPWTCATSLADVEQQPQVVKIPPLQIALFAVHAKIYAIDNRCPHEGYPLVKGNVDSSCTLTCNWHNWKFRLSDGECTLGGDDVRSYPVEIRGDEVWVNTDDPPAAERKTKILKGLRVAFTERDFARVCREVARLDFNDLDPLDGVRNAVQWTADRLEYGFTHAFAVAPDWLHLFDHHEGDPTKQLICLAESIDHMAFDALRHSSYVYHQSTEPFETDRFVNAVEDEDRELAEALAGGSVADQLPWHQVENAFATAALAHYNDFGHSLIYVYKTRQLIERLGESVELPLRLALARHLCYTTREDLLPEFSAYAETFSQLGEFATEVDCPVDVSDADVDLVCPFPASVRQAMRWLLDAGQTHSLGRVYDTLLTALASNLLHFDQTADQTFHRPVSDNVGWLNFTHGITFANAVRAICDRHPHLWKQGLLQMACFVGRNRGYLDVDLDSRQWHVKDQSAFFAEVDDLLLDHGFRDPIFSSHVVKTTLAVLEELEVASKNCRSTLLAAVHRFLRSPMKQKHTRRLAQQAIDLVSRDFAAK